jgi:ankyrin repeat protein
MMLPDIFLCIRETLSSTPSILCNVLGRCLPLFAKDNTLAEVRRFSVGADANAKDDDFGSTALRVACMKGHLQVAIKLLENGADIDAKNVGSATILYLSYSNGKLAVVIELFGPNDSDGATTNILGKRKHGSEGL